MTVAKYDQETRERALRLYYEAVAEDGATKSGARRKIGGMLISTQPHCTIRSTKLRPPMRRQWRNPSRKKTRSLLNEANEILHVGLSFFAQAEFDRTLK